MVRFVRQDVPGDTVQHAGDGRNEAIATAMHGDDEAWRAGRSARTLRISLMQT